MNGLKVILVAVALAVALYGASYFAFHPVAEVLGVDTSEIANDFIDNPFEVAGVLTSDTALTVLAIHSVVVVFGITFAVTLSLIRMFRQSLQRRPNGR